MTEFDGLIRTDLKGCLEAILFVASGPVSTSQLAEVVGLSNSEIEKALFLLDAGYQKSGGLSLQWQSGKVQLTTSPKMGLLVERFLGLESSTRISKAAVETLAVIGYKQPVTRPYIDSIRGVNSDAVIKSLLSKGFIQEIGRSDGPGRPIMYGTTSDFLQFFGLGSIKDLPVLEDGQTAIEEQPKENNKVLKD